MINYSLNYEEISLNLLIATDIEKNIKNKNIKTNDQLVIEKQRIY